MNGDKCYRVQWQYNTSGLESGDPVEKGRLTSELYIPRFYCLSQMRTMLRMRMSREFPSQWSARRYTVEPLNNGHIGDDHFVHCSEVVPSSEVEMYGQLYRQAAL